MKNTVRFFSFLLFLAILFGTLAVIPALAEGEGLTFTEYDLYKPVKTYGKTPNTFEAWVKLPKSAASTRGGVILGNYGMGNSVINFEIHNNGRPRLYWTESTGKVADWIFDNVNVCTDEWVHVAITRSVSEGKVYCYVNGTLKQTLSIASDKGREDIVLSSGLYVGGDIRSGNAQYFKGAIRGIAVYSDVRTGDEIKKDMTKIEDEADLLACYELTSHKRGDKIVDKSGNGCDADFVYNVTWIDPKDKIPVNDYAFSFAVVGDTQVINDKYPDKFAGIYDWIVDNTTEKKIKFVFGLGDITEKSAQAEWDRAKNAIHKMDGIVPYSLVRGNHDGKSAFNHTFPLSDYKDEILESFDGTMVNTCRKLTVGKINYLIFTLDYGPSNAVLNWVGGLCEQYSDHHVIITTHSYLFRDGTTLDQGDVCPPATTGGQNNGDHMWNKLISKHKNILMVISGHDPCDRIIVSQDKGVNGNVVTQMLVDPQGADAQLGGLGMVAILYFSEDGSQVSVEYYSTIKEKFYLGSNQFTMTLDMNGISLPDSSEDGDNNNNNNNDSNVSDTENVTDKLTETLPPQTEDAERDESDPPVLKTGAWVTIVIVSSVTSFALGVIVATVIIKNKKQR